MIIYLKKKKNIFTFILLNSIAFSGFVNIWLSWILKFIFHLSFTGFEFLIVWLLITILIFVSFSLKPILVEKIFIVCKKIYSYSLINKIINFQRIFKKSAFFLLICFAVIYINLETHLNLVDHRFIWYFLLILSFFRNCVISPMLLVYLFETNKIVQNLWALSEMKAHFCHLNFLNYGPEVLGLVNTNINTHISVISNIFLGTCAFLSSILKDVIILPDLIKRELIATKKLTQELSNEAQSVLNKLQIELMHLKLIDFKELPLSEQCILHEKILKISTQIDQIHHFITCSTILKEKSVEKLSNLSNTSSLSLVFQNIFSDSLKLSAEASILKADFQLFLASNFMIHSCYEQISSTLKWVLF